MSKLKNPPIKKFKVGRVNVQVWRNEGEKGPYLSINFDRRYKDDKVKWRSSTSFSPDDLPDLIAAAEMTRTIIPVQEPSGDEEE